ncbi:hypothetical protein [Fischerella thermalis]|uniref:hypothetical protein n=1 Tax=Fischerella thermalis TaxID=372787 RepID=UPI0002F1AA3F|nr:hypothetical protein [Fischerella thermalis]PLZ77824.1 hypothetical protein CBP16_20360 [Fischerella thermalis WC217]PLZ97144.1 hypothetical protein CI592_20985 [Fischerella thermalis CCMEE 5328]PLZ06873.1 hypothetical protein CBP18_18190 [Fischerella thermalis WC119]PLZ09933.1 hypothetical protein CBP19_15265 [Fischerella thermalis WC1110]PLZ11523.1 hypothetical protein CBP17_09735 [Fischerella thermalis WC114]
MQTLYVSQQNCYVALQQEKLIIKQGETIYAQVQFYPLSRHTLAQVETWGIGSPVIEPPSSVII